MVLAQGDKVLVAHRRLFADDHIRFFAGEVVEYENGMARVTGRTWLNDRYKGTFQNKADIRTTLISISSGTLIVYQLDRNVDVSELELKVEQDGSVVLTDDNNLSIDLTEGSSSPIRQALTRT